MDAQQGKQNEGLRLEYLKKEFEFPSQTVLLSQYKKIAKSTTKTAVAQSDVDFAGQP